MDVKPTTGAQGSPRRTPPPLLTKTIITVLVAGAVYLLTNVVVDSGNTLRLLISAYLGFTVLIIQYLVEQRREVEERRERRTEEKEAYQNLTEPDSLKILMDLNQRQIESYHEIVTKQAKQSYRSAQFAMWTGVIMLATCLYVGLKFNAVDIKAFAAAMGAVSGAMTGYLSKTYLAVYRETLSQLNRYFDQPVTNGYFLAAERLAGDEMPDMRQKIIEQILLVSMRPDEKESTRAPLPQGRKNARRSPKNNDSTNSAAK